MKKFFVLVFILKLSFFIQVDALTTGIAIPCYHKHFQFLPELLQSITRQTILPEKVVISLSQVELLNMEEVDDLENSLWPFEIQIIRRTGVFMEGSNRTKAVLHCDTDVILCIDADDIPHPQRIEAVLQLFEAFPNAKMILCAHAYTPHASIRCEPSIPVIPVEEYMNIRFELGVNTWLRILDKKDLENWASGVHNGAPSFRRSIIDAGNKWQDLKNGADIEFNRKIITDGYEIYLIQLPLLHYYNARTSGSDTGR